MILLITAVLFGLIFAASIVMIKKRESKIHLAQKELHKKDEIILTLREKLKELAVENSALEEELHKPEDDNENVKETSGLRPGFLYRLRQT